MNEPLFIVRLYDGFDYEWIDVSPAVSREAAERIWNEKTENGTINAKFNDIDYYNIFPADTRMLWSEEGRQDRKRWGW